MTRPGLENKGHQVFISYANEKGDNNNTGSDRQIADMICSALESENIRCWIDYRDIMPGENWVNAMFNAVEQSKVMVLVFSGNANQSQWVEDEVTYALDEKIRIIPSIEAAHHRLTPGFSRKALDFFYNLVYKEL